MIQANQLLLWMLSYKNSPTLIWSSRSLVNCSSIYFPLNFRDKYTETKQSPPNKVHIPPIIIVASYSGRLSHNQPRITKRPAIIKPWLTRNSFLDNTFSGLKNKYIANVSPMISATKTTIGIPIFFNRN